MNPFCMIRKALHKKYRLSVFLFFNLISEKVGIFYILYVFLNPFDPVSVLNPAVRLWRSGYSSAYRS